MYVRDIMTTDVITVPSSTTIADARRIMDDHGVYRLPVVDEGKLVGIVTDRRLERLFVSEAVSLTWTTFLLLNKTPVKEKMEKNVVTVPPYMTVEESVALAQKHKVGSLVVVEGGRIVGIATTNDYFYKLLNPVLGLGQPGTRIAIRGGGEGKPLEEIISAVNRLGLKMTNLLILASPKATREEKDVVIHIDSDNVSQLVADLETKGYEVAVRQR